MTSESVKAVAGEAGPMGRSTAWPLWRVTGGNQMAAIFVAACVSSLYGIIVAIASASLLFAGSLSGGLALGAGAALVGTVITSALIGWLSALPANIPQVQSMSFVVLAMTLGSSAAKLNAPAETRIGTAFVIIALTTAASAAVLLITGRLRAGRLVKFFPLEVLSGFVAGTGWLLVTGAMSVMTGLSPSIGGWLGLADPARIMQFLPAIVFGGALYAAMTGFRHPITMLVVMGLGIGLFYVWLFSTGLTVADAVAAGYLPRVEHGITASLPFPAALGHVDWPTVAVSLPGVFSVAVLSLLAGLLNISALELASGRATDIDRELRIAGVANALSVLVGAPPSNTGLATSILAVRLGVTRRGAGLLAALGVLVAIFFVEAIVAHVPRYVSAGLLVYFGSSMLKEWLIDTWRRYSAREWWVVVAIVLMVASYGFLTAILAGLLIATVLFAWSYASVPVIRSQTSLALLPSSHEWPPREMELLAEHGSRVTVIRLQGFLFFGTAERLVEPVRRAVRDSREPALAIILDFTAVTSIDTASATALSQLAREVAGRDCRLLLCGLAPALHQKLQRAGMSFERETRVEAVGTLDAGLEAMEDMILTRFRDRTDDGNTEPGRWPAAQADADMALLLPMMAPRTYEKGALIIAAGSASDGLGFLAEGRVEISIPNNSTQPLHVRSTAAGTLLGDIGFTLGIPRTADVIAQQHCLVYWITAAEASWLETHSPAHAAALNRVVSRSLARKVSSANRITAHLRG